MRLRPLWWMVAACLVAGCTGTPTPREATARRELDAVRRTYRPEDTSPTLPALSPASPLADFTSYGMLRHPKVAAAYYDWAASVERIAIERSLPDPVFTAGLDIQRGMEEDVASLVMSVMGGLMFELPGAGKLDRLADLATEESNAKFAAFQAAALEVALEVRAVHADLYLNAEVARLKEEEARTERRVLELSRRRVETGGASIHDIWHWQSEVEAREKELADLRDERHALLAAWKSVLGIPPGEPDPPFPARASLPPTATEPGAVLSEVLERNPELRVMKAEIARAEAALASASLAGNPDFAVGGEIEAPTTSGSRNPRDTILKPRASITLPIWRDRIAAEQAEAKAMGAAARERYSAEQLALAAEFARVAFGLRQQSRTLQHLDTRVLPQHRRIVELASRDIESGMGDLMQVFEHHKKLLEYERMRIEALVEQERLAAELALTLAGRIPGGSPFNERKEQVK